MEHAKETISRGKVDMKCITKFIASAAKNIPRLSYLLPQ